MFFGASGSYTGGTGTGDGAPIVLFEMDQPRAHGDGVVLSTYDEQFTSGCSLSQSGMSCGITADVVNVEKGYRMHHSTCLQLPVVG